MADFEFKAPAAQRPVVRYIVTGVIVLILLVILIWAIVHHFHKVSTQPPAQSPGTSQSGGSNQHASGSGSSGSGGNSSTNGSAGSNAPSSSAPKSSSNASGSQLTDTGPGDVVALFVATALLAGLSYQVRLRHRLAKGN